MDKQLKNINELHEWDKNPRNINEGNFQKLKDQLELKGQYKPLLIMPDGTVLGGNMRLKAMRQIGMEQVWVTIIDFIERDGLWRAVLDGQEQKETYRTKEDGMMAYSLSDNDRAGYYDADIMANIMPQFNLDWNQYSIDFQTPVSIQQMLENVAPEPTPPEVGEDGEHLVECPECHGVFNPKGNEANKTN